jgi:hypothetical protein
LDSRTELLKEHRELLKELDVVMEESRRTRERLTVIHQRVARLESQVESILSRREPAPRPEPAPAPVPEPPAASERLAPEFFLLPEPQSV